MATFLIISSLIHFQGKFVFKSLVIKNNILSFWFQYKLFLYNHTRVREEVFFFSTCVAASTGTRVVRV